MSEILLSGRAGAVAKLTLNRPEVYNAIDPALADALLEAVIACDEDPAVRAVVITGAGRAFCAGGDIQAMDRGAAETGAGAYLKRLTVALHGSVATIARMPKPVIMAVNGPAAGAGFSLALAGDMVIAAESASFTLAYTGIGLCPDGSSTFILPRLVGAKRAFELIALNRKLSAAEAQELGLVNEVQPDADLAAAVEEMAGRLAAGPTRAYGWAKRLLALSAVNNLEAQMEHEREGIAACAGSEDFAEGRAAFLAKRAPAFTGR